MANTPKMCIRDSNNNRGPRPAGQANTPKEGGAQ